MIMLAALIVNYKTCFQLAPNIFENKRMEQPVKRRRPYHSHNSSNRSKKQRKHALIPGLKGFLCSCNNREKECIRESYNILNKYGDLLYGAEPFKKTELETSQADTDDDFNHEIQALKHKGERRFQLIDSGAKNFLFIQTTLENPVELAQAIVTDIERTKQAQTRFLLRLIPVEITCKAFVEDIKKAFKSLAEKHFKNGAKSFSIVFNHRNNNNLSRDVVIQEVAAMINKQHKVDLRNPDMSVVVEVVRGVALLAVVPDYYKYKKYNLHLICGGDKGGSDAEVKNAEIYEGEVNGAEVEDEEVINAAEVEGVTIKENVAVTEKEDLTVTVKDETLSVKEDLTRGDKANFDEK